MELSEIISVLSMMECDNDDPTVIIQIDNQFFDIDKLDFVANSVVIHLEGTDGE
jgi:hypothetical protein